LGMGGRTDMGKLKQAQSRGEGTKLRTDLQSETFDVGPGQ